eukprot:10932780-Alexandrium_andersonii.AAC.1
MRVLRLALALAVRLLGGDEDGLRGLLGQLEGFRILDLEEQKFDLRQVLALTKQEGHPVR